MCKLRCACFFLSTVLLFRFGATGKWIPHSNCNVESSGSKCGVAWNNPVSSILKGSWNGGTVDSDECMWCYDGSFSCDYWDGTVGVTGSATDTSDCRQAGCLPSCRSDEETVEESHSCGIFFTATDEKCCKIKPTYKCCDILDCTYSIPPPPPSPPPPSPPPPPHIRSVDAGDLVTLSKVLATGSAQGDNFGRSVALHGETVVVGATGVDVGAYVDVGSVYVFARKTPGDVTSAWRQTSKLLPSDRRSNVCFGCSVAIDANTLAVGALCGPEQGSVYIFTFNTSSGWSQRAKLLASDGSAGDYFGESVSISGDTLVISAGGDNDKASQGGAVYVFTRTNAKSLASGWEQRTKIFPSDSAAQMYFGHSVSIDGDTIVVGARYGEHEHEDDGADRGFAYVFTRDIEGALQSPWTQRSKLIASDSSRGAQFANDVAISGDTIVVGSVYDDTVKHGVDSGSAYVFTRQVAGSLTSEWTQKGKLLPLDSGEDAHFGWSVSIRDDIIVVGSIKYDKVVVGGGSFYVFTRDLPGILSSNWTEHANQVAFDGAVNDWFGYDVAIDGHTVVVGARYDDDASRSNVGSAYVFGLISPPSYISDPDYKYQHWYLGPNGANVVGAWDLGFTGSGIHIRFNDDGLDYTHPEFSSKILPGWKDPMPASCTENTHGTSCAGIAAASSNDECGVGVAYNAYVSGANMLSRDSDLYPLHLEDGSCDADMFGRHGVDISSNSWGYDSCALEDLDLEHDISNVEVSCPFLKTNPYSPCGDMSMWDSREIFGDPKCSTSETWYSPSGISIPCKVHIYIYCVDSKFHAEVGYIDPACADYYDFFVNCMYHSLSNTQIDALVKGTSYGRGGRGIVYVFAAGNENGYGADTNLMGYTNSIYTISVGSLGGDNQHAVYSTAGASVLISAPGGETDQGFTTYETLPMAAGKCRVGGPRFVGTSMATPVVSGVVALMLEANPNLGWRDVQDILIRTAVVIDVDPDSPEDSWVTNAAGLSHSYEYGFGKVDAKAAVLLAQNYGDTNVKHNYELSFSSTWGVAAIPDCCDNPLVSTINVEDASAIRSAQHVVVYVKLAHSQRGSIRISLESPSGVLSLLLPGNIAESGEFREENLWKFMTLRHWGESPSALKGEWKLYVEDMAGRVFGTLNFWRLEILGNDANGDISGTLVADCAARNGAYSDVIGGSQCYEVEKDDSELNRAPSCDASSAPSNGFVGTCGKTLRSGLTCQPTCAEGYAVSGMTSCIAGTLVAATCSRLSPPPSPPLPPLPVSASTKSMVKTTITLQITKFDGNEANNIKAAFVKSQGSDVPLEDVTIAKVSFDVTSTLSFASIATKVDFPEDAFQESLAKDLNVSKTQILLEEVAQIARHLLAGVAVTYTVTGVDSFENVESLSRVAASASRMTAVLSTVGTPVVLGKPVTEARLEFEIVLSSGAAATALVNSLGSTSAVAAFTRELANVGINTTVTVKSTTYAAKLVVASPPPPPPPTQRLSPQTPPSESEIVFTATTRSGAAAATNLISVLTRNSAVVIIMAMVMVS